MGWGIRRAVVSSGIRSSGEFMDRESSDGLGDQESRGTRRQGAVEQRVSVQSDAWLGLVARCWVTGPAPEGGIHEAACMAEHSR